MRELVALRMGWRSTHVETWQRNLRNKWCAHVSVRFQLHACYVKQWDTHASAHSLFVAEEWARIDRKLTRLAEGTFRCKRAIEEYIAQQTSLDSFLPKIR
jgi:hypothetical protein